MSSKGKGGVGVPPNQKIEMLYHKKEKTSSENKERKNEDEFKHNGERKRGERSGIDVSDECDDGGKNVVGEIWI